MIKADIIVQAGALLPVLPWQLPGLLLAIGFTLITGGLIYDLAPQQLKTWNQLYDGERLLIIVFFLVGVGVGAFQSLQSRDLLWYYALILSTIGRGIEGALLTRFVAKILSFFYTGSKNMKERIIHKIRNRIARIFFTALISLSFVFVLIVAFIRNSTMDALIWTAISYTVARFGLTSVIVIYQLKDVIDRFHHFGMSSGMTISAGLVLAIGGAAIFDFPPFLGVVTVPESVLESPTGEFVVRFAGWFGLLAGVVISWGMLVRQISSNQI